MIFSDSNAQQCPDLNPIYWKSDSNPIEKIGFTLMFIYSIGIFIFNIKNLRILRKTRELTSKWKLTGINILMLYMSTTNLILFGDGLASLIIDGGYLDLKSYYIVQYQNMYSLQLVVASSWNQWMPLLAVYYGISRKKALKLTKVLQILFYVFFLGILAYITAKLLANDICDMLGVLRPELTSYVYISTGAITLNHIIFIISCYIVARNLEIFFYFGTKKSVTKMKIFAFITIYGALFRVLLDYSFYTSFTLYTQLGEQGNAIGASTSAQIPWVLATLLICFSCNLLPLTFLMINFSPSSIKAGTADTKQSDILGPGDSFADDTDRYLLKKSLFLT